MGRLGVEASSIRGWDSSEDPKGSNSLLSIQRQWTRYEGTHWGRNQQIMLRKFKPSYGQNWGDSAWRNDCRKART